MAGVWAVLVAAGRGERLGLAQPKAFAKLAGRPLLAESLVRLDASEWIDSIVIVAPPDWEEPAILLADELAVGKAHACVAGGATRVESVRAGLAEVPEEAAVVLVHDAARPLVSEDVVERLLAGLGEWSGVVPALRVPDTVKRVMAGRVVETVDRSDLYLVQTPQVFEARIFRDAIARAAPDVGDCAAAVEAIGGRVGVVEGDARLLKVTTAADLALVERLVEAP
ncbi:MAG: 2-C-methyl-D-erythritol 4-phosphate cytidylyltransferase [Actinobacteria bacterium]|nr:2-C-methyl-D-erythritol 4-phosphate cytidylyltransferase [Actinomycetota bacterium]